MKIAFFLIEEESRERFLEKFGDHEVKIFEEALNEDNIEKVRDVEVLVSRPVGMKTEFNRETLERFPNLRFILTMSTGFDHVDLEYCKERDIVVSNIPSYSEESVGEHVFALLLAMSKKIPESLIKAENVGLDPKRIRGFELKGRTLGVIGGGHIGLKVIRIAKGFGMKVKVYDVVFNEEASKELGFEYVELGELIEESDVISLHAPYNDNTYHLLKDNLSRVKEGCVIINTARGELIDHDVLIELLKSGRISAGLDVFEEDRLGELINLDNVILTPHNAANTKEAREIMIDGSIRVVEGFVEGRMVNVVGW
ncbi:hypothetical protein CMI42_01840 [Candidatus Pacearchaeota archaeon]|nr:hypothetical protein [Candidatus Pacearchaeota archaeon]